MSRGYSIIIEKSAIRAGRVVLRDPVSYRTIGTRESRAKALRWCRREGFSPMEPPRDVSHERLEERI